MAEAYLAFGNSQWMLTMPRDRWIDVRYSMGERRWVWVGKDGTGRHSRTPPEGIDPKDILIQELSLEPSFDVRRLVQRIVSDISDADVRSNFESLVQLLIYMEESDFDQRLTRQLVSQWRLDLYGFGNVKGVMDSTHELPTKLFVAMLQYQLPGYLVGLLTLLCLAWQDAMPVVLSRLEDANQIRGAHDLVKKAFDILSQDFGPSKIQQASDTLRDYGQKLQTSAKRASRDGDFYGDLYLSCPAFIGAMWGYRYLETLLNADPQLAELSRKMANACEEQGLLAFESLWYSFLDGVTQGSKLRADQEMVKKVWNELGRSEGEAKAKELVDFYFRYPKYYYERLVPEKTADSKPQD